MKKRIFLHKNAIASRFDGQKQQVELKKREFEHQGKSGLKAFSGICRPSQFHCTEQKQKFSEEHSNTKRKL